MSVSVALYNTAIVQLNVAFKKKLFTYFQATINGSYSFVQSNKHGDDTVSEY